MMTIKQRTVTTMIMMLMLKMMMTSIYYVYSNQHKDISPLDKIK